MKNLTILILMFLSLNSLASTPTPIYESFESFVVNVSDKTDRHGILQLGFVAELKGSDPVYKKVIEEYLPSIRSALIILLSSKDLDEIKTAEGKARLRAQIRLIINEVVAETGIAPVQSISFNSFIIQDDL